MDDGKAKDLIIQEIVFLNLACTRFEFSKEIFWKRAVKICLKTLYDSGK